MNYKEINVRKLLFVVIAAIILSQKALACSVPVYRYALERWQADNFRIAVIYKDSLNSETLDIVKETAAICREMKGDHSRIKTATAAHKVNAMIHLVNAAEPKDNAERALLTRYRSKQLPYAVVFFPPKTGIRQPLWTGSADKIPIKELFFSPVRQKISKYILDGETAVWVLIKSGDKKKDKMALKALEQGLKKSEGTLKLPDLADDDREEYIEKSGRPDLRISFSVVQVSREQIEERFLIGMLELSEKHLRYFTKEPMAFPLFGRGRALYGLVGGGINTETVLESNAFLTGPCACTVKEQNPGKDILILDNWDSGIKNKYVAEKEVPKLQGIGSFIQQKKKGN